MGRDALGEFEQLVLLAVLRLGEQAYGVPVVEEISRRTSRDVSRASVYVTLRRLDRKGLLETSLGDPTPERGGRAKKFYTLSEEGLRALAEARSDFLNMWDGVESAVEGV